MASAASGASVKGDVGAAQKGEGRRFVALSHDDLRADG